MYTIRIAQAAEHDFQMTADYISSALQNPQAALHLLDEAQKAVDSLREFPRRFSIVQDPLLAAQGIRMTQIKRYLLFYVVDDAKKTVSILRFVYERRDWKALLS